MNTSVAHSVKSDKACYRMGSCYVKLEKDRLEIGNDKVKRLWNIKNGLLYPASFLDVRNNVEWIAGESDAPSPYPPLDLPPDEFRRLIGEGKYQQYLNYFYGIPVEEALFLAVQAEVRKEKRTLGYNKERDTVNEVYRRIYGATKAVLRKRFRRERGYPQTKSITLTGLKEFTYWLFKYRLKQCDKTRVASDTKKAMEQLKRLSADSSLASKPLASVLEAD